MQREYQIGNKSPSSFCFKWNLGVLPILSPTLPGVDELDITYLELVGIHEANLSLKNPVSDQVLRNHKGTLKAYLAFCNKSMESKLGREFTVSTEFRKQFKAFRDVIAAENRKTAADKCSILRSWKKTIDGHVRAKMLKSMSGHSLFHKELQLVIAQSNQSVKEIAKAIRSSDKTLSSWLEGVSPIFNSMPTLRRLEKYLDLEPGYLETKVVFPTNNGGGSRVAGPDSYELRLRSTYNDRYYVTTAMFSEDLIQEWVGFVHYKTCQHPVRLKRGKGAQWRCLPIDKANQCVLREVLCMPEPGMTCPSANRHLQTLQSYLGFLTKKQDLKNRALSGLGLPLNNVQTLAMYVIPEFVNAYLEFVKARAGGIVHGGHTNAAAAIATLCRPGTGFLSQQPGLLSKIEAYTDGRSWADLCAQTIEVCQSWENAAKGRKSRDPEEQLRLILSLEDPLNPFKEAIKKLDIAAAAAAPGSVYQALYKRDALLLALSLFNPLRSRTLTITKYIAPDEPFASKSNLYQAEDGQWWLRYEKGDFKNDGSKPEAYNSPITRDLSFRLEQYLEIYRPVLTRSQPSSPWLFPNNTGGRHCDVSDIIFRIAKHYIPEVRRLRLHALRHIVATAFLRRNPGQYVHLAGLLHDRLDTVLRTYSHGKTQSAFRAQEENMKGFFDGI